MEAIWLKLMGDLQQSKIFRIFILASLISMIEVKKVFIGYNATTVCNAYIYIYTYVCMYMWVSIYTMLFINIYFPCESSMHKY